MPTDSRSCHLGDLPGSPDSIQYTSQWKTPAGPGSFRAALRIILASVAALFYGALALSVLVLLFSTVGMKRSHSADLLVPANAEEGVASVDDGKPTRYDSKNYRGRISIPRARFNRALLAVAHRTLPLRSCVMVAKGARFVQASVRDRGPCLSAHCQRTAPNRVKLRKIDLWPAVARRIGCDGLCRVKFWPVPCGAAA